TLVAGTPSKVTSVAPVRWVPARVKPVPPEVVPEPGFTAVRVTAAAASARQWLSTSTRQVAPAANVNSTAHAAGGLGSAAPGGKSVPEIPPGKQLSKSGSSILRMVSGSPLALVK